MAGFETGKLHIVMRGEPKAYDFDRLADATLAAAAPDLLAAAQTVLAGLCERIESAEGNHVPVFAGIADLSDAINKALGQ